MVAQFTGRDALVVLALFIVSAAAGAAFVLLRPDPEVSALFTAEIAAVAVTGLVLATLLYAVVRVNAVWGGTVLRGLNLVAAGTVIEAVAVLLSLHWRTVSIQAATDTGTVAPTFLMVPGAWWVGFLPVLAAAGFAVIAYGFYILYTAVKPATDTLRRDQR